MGTEGPAVPGVEVRIETGQGANYGEILVRGPNVFGGYQGDPARTRATFTPDGWFRTGDLEPFNRGGYLHVVGRIDELIVIPDGDKIFPVQVEQVYCQNPFVRKVAVLLHGGRLAAIIAHDLEALRTRWTARIRSVVNEKVEFPGQSFARFEQVTGTVFVAGPLPGAWPANPTSRLTPNTLLN
jgi:long-subunit acyl-CoA synthetase (AMP-forming)